MVSGKDLEGLLNAVGKLKLIETQGKTEKIQINIQTGFLLCRCSVGPKKWAAYDTDIECTKPEKFGMYHGKPCIMVKLNRVYGWEPEPYYNTTEVGSHAHRPTRLITD